MAIVRQDRHGLYVITNGTVFRPEWTESTFTSYSHIANSTSPRLASKRFMFHAQLNGTDHKVGEEVTARAIAGTELATINGKLGERWTAHHANRSDAFPPTSNSEHYWTPLTRATLSTRKVNDVNATFAGLIALPPGTYEVMEPQPICMPGVVDTHRAYIGKGMLTQCERCQRLIDEDKRVVLIGPAARLTAALI